MGETVNSKMEEWNDRPPKAKEKGAQTVQRTGRLSINSGWSEEDPKGRSQNH